MTYDIRHYEPIAGQGGRQPLIGVITLAALIAIGFSSGMDWLNKKGNRTTAFDLTAVLCPASSSPSSSTTSRSGWAADGSSENRNGPSASQSVSTR